MVQNQHAILGKAPSRLPSKVAPQGLRTVARRSPRDDRARLMRKGILVGIIALVGANCQAQPPVAPENPAVVRLSTLGYLPGAEKCATVAGSGGEFIVRDAATGNEVFRGPLKAIEPNLDAAGVEHLLLADFSSLKREGTYRLKVTGAGDSPEFRIHANIFDWPFYCVARGMYLLRCGCAVEGEFHGHAFRQVPCHLHDA